jgi:hypothetical protein
MFGCLGQSQQQAHDAEVIARAMAVPALAALAVIHVVDLPNTLSPTPLVGIGYFGIIAAGCGAWQVWTRATRADEPRRPLRTMPEYSPRS